MIVAGGAAEHRWTVASTDYHASSGRVIRRQITITIEGDTGSTPHTQLVLDRADAKRLASAILLTTKHGDPASRGLNPGEGHYVAD